MTTNNSPPDPDERDKYSGMTVTADDLREAHERQARYALSPEENRALPPVRPAQRSKDG